MALRVKFPVLNERTVFGIDGPLGEEALRKHFAHLVRKSIEDIDAANDRAVGHDVQYRTWVDGAESANLESVKLGGTITARWRLGSGVVAYIWDLLRGAGPKRSGRYRDSARLFIDGRETTDPQDADGAREALFISGVPYARKIERGAKGYAPGRVYESVAAQARARYANVALIKFTYVPDDALSAFARSRLRGSRLAGARRQREYDRLRRQPAIIVYLT